MQSDTLVIQSSTMQATANLTGGYAGVPNGNVGQQSPGKPPAPPKTDKPRPHVCGTCSRSFARLEHLKRHERSHTKEKPFECPECTRCFARRDLLLRHQQKLHMTQTPSSRPRAGSRRESTSSVATTGGRVRKNSVSNVQTAAPVSNGDGGASTMRSRPRANTIAHIDQSTMDTLANNHHFDINMGRGRSGNSAEVAAVANMGFGTYGPQPQHHQESRHSVPRIDTSLSSLDLGGMMPRSASHMALGYDELEGLLFSNTVNPAALHMNMSPLQQPIGSPTSPFGPPYPSVDSTYYSVDDTDEGFDWMNMLGGSFTSEPLDQSSPSAFSNASASGVSGEDVHNEPMWSSAQLNAPSQGVSFPSTEFRTHIFNDTPPPDLLSMSPSTVSHHFVSQMSNTPTDHTMASSMSFVSANYQPQTATAGSITDSVRGALLSTLVQSSGFVPGGPLPRRHSNASQSPNLSSSVSSVKHAVNLPATRDLQRFTDSYIQYFHPHLPFLHLPTLRFDTCQKVAERSSPGSECLVLSMAAIGALYEFKPTVAWELFTSAKKTVEIVLEERRKAGIATTMNSLHAGSTDGADGKHTPLWLVQSFLLNVIFGLQCGDQTACSTAISQCSPLVSLARSAHLTDATAVHEPPFGTEDADIQMADLEMTPFGDSLDNEGWCGLGIKVDVDEGLEWSNWIVAEERKRTLYAVHYLSSLLVASHNQPPTLINNQITINLPCDEQFWNAESVSEWKALGGASAISQNAISFMAAFNELLSGGQTQYSMLQNGVPGIPEVNITIKPSAFGCLVLICALHVYIWETRQRTQARQWTTTDAEALQAHITPALKAWQMAFNHTATHTYERPNPHGTGPLSADCVPLLDMAYIRLYVDLGRAKEHFWAREFEQMSEELSRGWDHGHSTPPSSASSVSARSESAFSNAMSPASSPASTSPSPNLRPLKMETNPAIHFAHPSAPTLPHATPNSKREKQLRQAAWYAADHLAMTDTLAIQETAGTFTCRELPIQSALCAFEGAQVLAEWLTTVQIRVVPYVGLLGCETCDIDGPETQMMLQAEDRKLIAKVTDMLRAAESKMSLDHGRKDHPFVSNSSLGPTLLRVSAYVLDKGVVWQATRLMAQALRAQAELMDVRVRRAMPLQN